MTSRRKPNFDRIARPYRWLETLSFGQALERCRNHFLPQLADCRSALVLGDGDGRFLAALLAAHPHLTADAVDSSAAMLQQLERRAHAAVPDSARRLRTHHSDALAFQPPRAYDLIVTHFFLDCLTQAQLELLCAHILPCTGPNTLWLLSDFRIPAGAMRQPARLLIRSLYLGFRILTGLRTHALPDHAVALAASGFRRIAGRHSLAGVLTTELWQLGEYTAAMLPPQRPTARAFTDPVPDPEPASPSLPEPDPGVFHHEPGEDASGGPPSPPPTAG